MPQAVADAHLKRRMLAAGAIVGLLIPVIWFAFFYLGTGILVPHIFNMEGLDYIIFAIWPSFLILLLVWNQSAARSRRDLSLAERHPVRRLRLRRGVIWPLR